MKDGKVVSPEAESRRLNYALSLEHHEKCKSAKRGLEHTVSKYRIGLVSCRLAVKRCAASLISSWLGTRYICTKPAIQMPKYTTVDARSTVLARRSVDKNVLARSVASGRRYRSCCCCVGATRKENFQQANHPRYIRWTGSWTVFT